jgi:ABC-2 type transport system permease protein
MATAASGSTLWWSRAVVRAAVVYAAVVAPLIVGALVSGSAMGTLLLALLQVALYVAFWTVLIVLVGAWRQPAGAIASALLGAWLLLAVLLPAAGRVAIDRLVEMPAGADILLTQREAVNDAWDLPKEATMTAFLEREPQLRAFAEIKQPFEWKWYYAFQQVGDQKAESLAQAYRDGRERRDALAQRLAWLSPPALMERSLQRLARTDMQAVRAYEDEVRSFHAALRAYYYPPLFKEDPVDDAALSSMPLFVPRESKL